MPKYPNKAREGVLRKPTSTSKKKRQHHEISFHVNGSQSRSHANAAVPVQTPSPTPIPTIENVSANVVPLLLQAVKSQKKYISLKHKLANTSGNIISIHNAERSTTNMSTSSSTSISSKSSSARIIHNHNSMYQNRNGNGNGFHDGNDLHAKTSLSSSSGIHIQEQIFERMESSTHDAAMTTDPLHQQFQETQHAFQSLLHQLDKEVTDIKIPMHRRNNPLKSTTTTTTMRTSAEVQEREDMNISASTNCAIGCLLFLLDILSDKTSKIILRNAALCTIHTLVQHRNDCRATFIHSGSDPNSNRMIVKAFVDSVGDADEHLKMDPSGKKKIGKLHHVAMYQRDALQFLNDLSERFENVQPTLVIAARYLEEQKGISLSLFSATSRNRGTGNGNGNHSSSSLILRKKTNADMMELRRIRDVALKFAPRELKRVNKVLGIVDSCFGTLVPRFGHGHGHGDQFHSSNDHSTKSSSSTLTSSLYSLRHESIDNSTEKETDADADADAEIVVEAEEDSDDDGIEWEDGDGDDGDDDKNNNEGATRRDQNETLQSEEQNRHEHEHENRLSAVEQTLAVMKRSGALKNDGTLEVVFDTNKRTEAGAGAGTETATGEEEQSSETHSFVDNVEHKDVKQKLSKCIKFLTKRLDKISMWIDAIVHADNMTDASRLRSTMQDKRNARTRTSTGVPSSAVLLPQSVRSIKGATKRSLINLKDAIERALTAEAKIGMSMSHQSSTQIQTGTEIEEKKLETFTGQQERGENASTGTTTLKSEQKDVSCQSWQNALGLNRETAKGVRRNRQTKKSKLLIKLRES